MRGSAGYAPVRGYALSMDLIPEPDSLSMSDLHTYFHDTDIYIAQRHCHRFNRRSRRAKLKPVATGCYVFQAQPWPLASFAHPSFVRVNICRLGTFFVTRMFLFLLFERGERKSGAAGQLV